MNEDPQHIAPKEPKSVIVTTPESGIKVESKGGAVIVSGKESEEVTLFGVSVRAWITLVIVMAACLMSIIGMFKAEMRESEFIKNITLIVVGYYFGANNKR